jgi:hypothetical protein
MSGTQTDIGFKDSHNAKRDEFAKPSRETYNTNHGRVASAPTVGAGSHAARSPKGTKAVTTAEFIKNTAA